MFLKKIIVPCLSLECIQWKNQDDQRVRMQEAILSGAIQMMDRKTCWRIWSSRAKEWEAQAWAKHGAVPSMTYPLPLRLPSGWHPGSHIYIAGKDQREVWEPQQGPWAQAMNPAQCSRLWVTSFQWRSTGSLACQQGSFKQCSTRARAGHEPQLWKMSETASLRTSGRYILGLVDALAKS